MNVPPSELAGLISRCQAGIAAVLRQGGSRKERAAGFADLLRELTPDAALTACLLCGEGSTSLEVRSAGETPDAERKQALRSQIESIGALAARVQVLPPLSPGSGLRTLVAAIHEDGRARGFLAIALACDAAIEEVARAEALLSVCAPIVALRWTLETIRGEQAELARFALTGQAFLGLAHELNNALNSMMLQTSVVQMRVDPQARQDLNGIRQHGAQAAALLRTLQHVVQDRRDKSYAVDLNGAVAEVLEEEPEPRQAVPVQFAAESPRIEGTRGAVKQFVRLVLQGVRAGTQSAPRLRTENRPDGAALSVEIPQVKEEGALSSAESVLWQNLDEVGRQAGQSLLRQLGGEMAVEPGRDSGLVLRVIWGCKA